MYITHYTLYILDTMYTHMYVMYISMRDISREAHLERRDPNVPEACENSLDVALQAVAATEGVSLQAPRRVGDPTLPVTSVIKVRACTLYSHC